MFAFSKESKKKYDEPIFCSIDNPLNDDESEKRVRQLFYINDRDERERFPKLQDPEMLLRIQRRIPPKKLADIPRYEKKLDDYKLLNGLKISAQEGQVFMPTPRINGRNIIVVAAPSGSGKSVFCNIYIRLFHKLHPDRKIYIISHIQQDKSLEEGIEGLFADGTVKRIQIDDELIDSYQGGRLFDINEFKDSLLLADDYDSISDKNIREFIELILDQCMKIGRHENINILITSHLLYSGCGAKHSRIVLSEANAFVLFPSRSTLKSLNHLCGNYLGLDNKTVEDLRRRSDRYVMINKCPPFIVGQNIAEVI